MFLAAKEFPLPVEYRFLPLEEVFHEPPADVVDRTLVFLDCGNIDRMPVDFLQRDGARVAQHRPPPRQHPLRRRQPRRRRGLVHRRDRLRARAACSGPSSRRRSPTALYVGLVTDTGRFMYENTDAGAHRMAAELIEAGVDVNDTYRRLYERVPIEKLRLISRALEKIERFDDGRLAVTYISADDYEPTGAERGADRGDHRLPALARGHRASPRRPRQAPTATAHARKVSLRSTDGAIDVSAIAREHGGGGHPRAAGFSHRPPLRRARRVPACEVRGQL